MEKVLITGGTGLLGTHILAIIDYSKFEVFCTVRSTSKNDHFSHLPLKYIQSDLSEIISKTEGMHFDYIIHAAALMSAETDEETLLKVNYEGTKEMVKLAKLKRPKRFIYISSVVAMGTNLSPHDPFINEESPNITLGLNYSNYDSKRLGENEVIKCAKKGEINAIILNPTVMLGARDALKPVRKTYLLAAQGRLLFYVAGGINVVGVEDVALAVINSFCLGRSSERYILGGENITTKDLFSKYARLNNQRAPFIKIPLEKMVWIAKLLKIFKIKTSLTEQRILSYTSYHWSSSEKAKKELNFNPASADHAIFKSFTYMKDMKLI